jgi:hypothetical protein
MAEIGCLEGYYLTFPWLPDARYGASTLAPRDRLCAAKKVATKTPKTGPHRRQCEGNGTRPEPRISPLREIKLASSGAFVSMSGVGISYRGDFGPSLYPYSPKCVEEGVYEVGGLSLLSDYCDRAMGVSDHRIRDTAQQSPP